MRKIYILTLSALLISALAMGQNLVLNGDLESWDDANTPTSWNTKQNITQENVNVHGGDYAAAQTSASGTKKLEQLIENIIPGHTYRISFWYLDNDANARMRLWSSWKDDANDWLNDDDAVLHWSSDNYTQDNSDWLQFSVELTAPTNATKFNFGVRTYKQDGNTGGKIYFDDFLFEDITTSNPIISIVSPQDNYQTTNTAFDVEFSVLNFNVAESGLGDGHITYILDGNATEKYDVTPISLTDLSSGQHQFIIKLVDDASQDLSPEVADTLNFEIFDNTGENILLNGDVESWIATNALDSWTTTENITQESVNVHGGMYSAKQTMTAGEGGAKKLSQDVAVIPGHFYEIKYYYYDNDANAKTRIYGGFRDASDTWTGSDVFRTQSYSADQDAWVEFSVMSTAPEGAEVFRFDVRAYNDNDGGGSVFYDDFSITDLSSVGCRPVIASSVKMYPNPVENILTIDGEQISKIQILDVNAKVLKVVSNLNENKTIDVTFLEKGIYFVKVTSKEGTTMSKLIKL